MVFPHMGKFTVSGVRLKSPVRIRTAIAWGIQLVSGLRNVVCDMYWKGCTRGT